MMFLVNEEKAEGRGRKAKMDSRFLKLMSDLAPPKIIADCLKK
jgi:hypothetical protein